MDPDIEPRAGRLPKPVVVRDFLAAQPGLTLVTDPAGLARPIHEPTVNRPGLLLAGFNEYFADHRVQVMGSVERHYLNSLPPEVRRARLAEFFSRPIPCVVFCRGAQPDEVILELARTSRVPVFVSAAVTMNFISQATLALEELFAPTETLHGSMVDILGIGVLIMGTPGIGKSECAVGLIERGYALVADDSTLLRLRGGRHLIGTSLQLGRNYMEVRGIGIVDVPAMFGVKAIRTEKQLDLAVTLKHWEDVKEIERVGDVVDKITILGVQVPHMTIPIRPGRDLARLVEVAAFHTKLQVLGYNPARAFNEALLNSMRPPGPA